MSKEIPSKRYAANTAVVYFVQNGTADDKFRVQFAPDNGEQSINQLQFSNLKKDGKVVEFGIDDNPFTMVTPCTGRYRIINVGVDDTDACVGVADTYEVTPYVNRG